MANQFSESLDSLAELKQYFLNPLEYPYLALLTMTRLEQGEFYENFSQQKYMPHSELPQDVRTVFEQDPTLDKYVIYDVSYEVEQPGERYHVMPVVTDMVHAKFRKLQPLLDQFESLLGKTIRPKKLAEFCDVDLGEDFDRPRLWYEKKTNTLLLQFVIAGKDFNDHRPSREIAQGYCTVNVATFTFEPRFAIVRKD
jgi:hypothetical protein